MSTNSSGVIDHSAEEMGVTYSIYYSILAGALGGMLMVVFIGIVILTHSVMDYVNKDSEQKQEMTSAQKTSKEFPECSILDVQYK